MAKILVEQVKQFCDRGDITSGALWPCSDRKMRHSWPILASWLADHMEHANLMGIKYNSCPRCETAKDELGSVILPPDLEYHLGK